MLRELKQKDADKMYEWMCDENALQGLNLLKFNHLTKEDCENFIRESRTDKNNLHLAIVDNKDEYCGTVSLKDIYQNQDAEFAIVLRSQFQGKGLAAQAMKDIFRIGFERMGLEEIYWNVKKENIKAQRLYTAGGYSFMEHVQPRRMEKYKEAATQKQVFLWYHMTREQYFKTINTGKDTE